MEAPEYLDLDEIDFSDDSAYAVTSLKNIPELSRRNDGQGEERQATSNNWTRGVSSHTTGIAEVHSKFRPVKRVSPLKHQPETSDTDTDSKGQDGNGCKEHASLDKQPEASTSTEWEANQTKPLAAGTSSSTLFGELEHYDLDMDEILDVPYIKSSQQISTLPLVPHDKRAVSGESLAGTLERKYGSGGLKFSLHQNESVSLGSSTSSSTPYCVLSPVKWSDMRKSKSMDPDFYHNHHHQSPGGTYSDHSPGGLGCSAPISLSVSDADRPLAGRGYVDPQCHDPSLESPAGKSPKFPLPVFALRRQDSGKGLALGGSITKAYGGEVDEENKKNQNIINTIREGQISLLPHLAADNLELIRDGDGNNLLHISSAQGHVDCLQHLTSLMGEDGLNERNAQQLTPAGLGVKNGHLECVRWMVSETEAIAELSCSREHPSLIHYAAHYGKEKVLLWLLQFMQEQAISLDEVDQYGNSAVHIAAQYGHLSCIQTLVEYGSNVTVQNQQGERPSQSAERKGHNTCARYLVVVETCMSLASQVVKLTKQLNEQSLERIALQNKIQSLLDPSKVEGTPSRSPNSHQPSAEAWPEMTLTSEGTPGDNHWVVRQGGVAMDTVTCQLLGRDMFEAICPRERIPPTGSLTRDGLGAPGGSNRRMGLVETRELKLAKLKQIMSRSLSESDSDVYPSEDGKQQELRPDRPTRLPIVEAGESVTSHLHQVMRKHLPSASSTIECKSAFTLTASKSFDTGDFNPSPTFSDPEVDFKTLENSGDFHDGQKVATSPKSALKSPSSRRKTSQNLKLRVTFDEHIHKTPSQEVKLKQASDKEIYTGRTQIGCSEVATETWKRPFGTFRSIMESLSGNQNNNNTTSRNSQPASSVKVSSSGFASVKHSCLASSHNSPNKKTIDAKTSLGGPNKGKNKTSAV